jgi:adenylate kinase
MLQGKLLSDDEMIAILDTVLNLIDPKQEFVLDGFPRTTAQTDWLLDQVHQGRLRLTAVVNLDASEEVVKKRLISRGRRDDNETAIKERFAEYHSVTLPILDYFKKEGVEVHTIDASQEPRAVHDEILKRIG